MEYCQVKPWGSLGLSEIPVCRFGICPFLPPVGSPRVAVLPENRGSRAGGKRFHRIGTHLRILPWDLCVDRGWFLGDKVLAPADASHILKRANPWHIPGFEKQDSCYCSTNALSFRARLGCRSLRSALASICRMRSRVTSNTLPTSSSV